MRRILNVALVFVLSLMIVGLGYNAVKAEATEDVTITIHVHQYDGVYTNTGIGVWDGQNWNDWGALQSSVDEFGAVIVLNYTAAEINAVMDSIQFEITSESVAGAGGDDAAAQGAYLSPGDGKTFLDVTTLKSGDATTLEVYYVEGAVGFEIAEEGFGKIFVVYADPTVAANLAVYDTWNMWTWGNGTLGSLDGTDFALDMVQNTGTYDVPMKLGVLNVDSDTTDETGFIVRTEEWSKQCGIDMFIDNTSVRGSGTLVYYYQAGSCDLETDGVAFLADIDMKYEMNAGNRFLETNNITSPTTIDVELLMPQNPGAYDVSRFTLLDSLGVEVPLVSAEVSTMADLGEFTSDVTCALNENLFVLYVASTLDHSLLGVVGSLQGWDPANAVMSTKDDENGLAVFEICTTDVSGEYKVLYNNVIIDDPLTLDVDESGFDWGDNALNAENASFDFGGERMGYFYIDANVPTVSSDFVGTFVSDYTPLVDEKVLTIHFETTEARDKIAPVGDFVLGWDGSFATPYISTKDDTSGYAVFEVPTMNATGEFKILFDNDDSGFNWGDTELSNQLAYDFGDSDTLEIFINAAGDIAYIVGGTAVATPLETTKITLTVDVANELQPGNDYFVNYEQLAIENHVTIYVDSALEHSQLGIVGSIQGWNPAEAIISTQDSSLGYAVFEVVMTEDSGEFKVLFNDGVDDPLTLDVDESLVFNWGDTEVTPGDNITFEVGASGVAVLYITEIGTFTSDFAPADLPAEGLFFSEYGEPDGGSCKYVEIHNPTDATIDLTGWTISSPDEGDQFDTNYRVDVLTGDILAGQTIVVGAAVCFDGSDADSFNAGFPQVGIDYIISSGNATAYFNGDDALGLFNGDVLVDMIGNVGEFAPTAGGSWAVGNGDLLGGEMENVVMVRVPVVSGGETDWAVAAMQWIVQDHRDYTTVGTHTYTPTLSSKKVILHFDTALAGTEIAVVGDFVQSWAPDAAMPYISTKIDSDGYAVFELPVVGDTGEFKILYDEDANGFVWGDTELTSQFVYEITSNDVVEYQINADGDVMTLVAEAGIVTTTVTDMAIVGDIVQELFAAQYMIEVVESVVLPFSLSNELVVADAVNEMGTYATTKDEIALEFLFDPTTVMGSLELLEDGVVIPYDSITLANPGIGTYTETVTCGVDENKLTVHVFLNDFVYFSQLGLVGSVQTGDGWDIDNTIPPTGIDSNGNYVFEVCVDNTKLDGAFKIKFDPDSDGFTWNGIDDPEMTPGGNATFDFDGDTTLYIEEGQESHGTSVNHLVNLTTQIDVTKDYMLRFVDDNGFIVEMDLDIDNEAPVLQFSEIVDVVFEVDQDSTFDIMNYLAQLSFIDNRDGELDYVVTSAIDTAVLGEQTFAIAATDMWDNVTTLEYLFTVVDATAPVVTLEDAPELLVGDVEPDWTLYGATNEGTLVIDASQIDMEFAGTYYVHYTATDAAENVTSESLEVTVDALPVVEDEGISAGVITAIVVGAVAVIGGAALFFVKKS